MIKLGRLLSLVALIAPAAFGFGQATNSANINGSVTDPSGAVIPGVTITVHDIDKDTNRTYTSDSSGLYETGPIVPDHYMVTFAKEGFSTLQRGPMTLQVGPTGLNSQLTLGEATQVVSVNENAPLLETTASELSSTLNSQTLEELPQVGTAPDWQPFIILQAGTSSTTENGGSNFNPGMGGTAANGSLPFSTALMDGATTSSPMSNNVIMTPIFESIGEVKMSSSLFSAQYGVGGILYNQISKGGTNTFHGTVYDYFQNDATNAAPYGFGNKAGVPHLRYNDYGFNVGGPVLKNRIFFFFNFDNTTNISAGTSSTFISVPTASMRNGDFTGQNTLYDPTTQTVDANGVLHRQSFASEYGNGNRIPTALLSPVALKFQNYFPAANGPGSTVNGVTTNNFSYLVPSTSHVRKWFGRLDADVTRNNRITASEAWNNTSTIGLGANICPANCQTVSLFNNNAQLTDVWTINANTINEARLGFMAEYDKLTPLSLGQGIPSQLGLQFAKADIFPTTTITNIYGLGPGVSANYKENIFDPSDVVTLIRGKHVLTFGGEFLIERADSTAWGNINAANLTFSGVYTASSQGTTNNSGSAYADFLLGDVQAWSASVTPEYAGRLKSPQLFFQDDIKLRPNLTVNAGIRWIGQTGWHDVKGNLRSFDPTVTNPTNNTLGAVWYGTTAANGRTSLQKPVWTTFTPRVGFSYQPDQKTTLRGGFGMYTFPWSVDTYGSGLGGVSGSNGNLTDNTNGIAPVVLLNSDGNTNYQGSQGASINSKYQPAPQSPNSYNGQAIGYTQYVSPIPTLMQWNVSVQREVSSNMVAQLAYVASKGYNLPWLTDLNQIPANKLGPNDTVGATNARPYPLFQALAGVNAIATSNYNSLQASVQRRLSSGLEFNFNYTWSKFLDEQDSSGWGTKEGNQYFQNGYDPTSNYGPSNFDVRNAFKGQAIYQLPIGAGRAFLNNNAFLNETIGGWRASGTVVVQSGNPFTPYMSVNNTFSQAGNQYPNVVGSPTQGAHTVAQWFNVAAFAAPTPGTFGNMRRNSVYGPGMTVVNFSLAKSFPIWEHVTADFSADATNVFNHPSFGLPDPQIGPGHTGQITTVTVGGRAMQFIGKIRF